MRRLRTRKEYTVTDGPVPGRERILASRDDADSLSEEGSIDSVGKETLYNCDCGCFGSAGGRCYDCGSISCGSCHGRCARCAKPVCLAHSVFAELAPGRAARLCSRCHCTIARQRWLGRIGRLLLSPFVDFGE